MSRRLLFLLLLAGDGRTGQYKLPVLTAFIDKMSYRIP